MGYYEDYLEDKKKQKQSQSVKENGVVEVDKVYQAYLEDKKKRGYETPKPSQVAKEEVKPVETKKPSFFEQVKTKATDLFSSLSGKKKIEEQLSKAPAVQTPTIDTTKIQPRPDYGLKLYDLASGKTAEESAKSTGVKSKGYLDKDAWGNINPLPLGDVGPSLIAGAGEIVSNAGKVAKWKGYDGLAQKLIDKGGELQQFMPDVSEFEDGVNWKDFANPRLYTTLMARSSTFTLAMMPLALGVGAAIGMAAPAVGIGLFGTWILSSIGSGLISSYVEASSEAGGVYDEVFTKTGDRQKADKAAQKDFNGNILLLTASNTIQYALLLKQFKSLSNIAKGIKVVDTAADVSKTTKALKLIGTATGEFISEGGEETGQTKIRENAMGEEFNLTQEDAIEFIMGGLQGLIFTAGGAIIDSTTGKDVTAEVTKNGIDRANMTVEEIKDRIVEEIPGVKEDIQKKVDEGVEFETARDEVLNTLTEDKKPKVQEIAKEVIIQKTEEDGEVAKQVDVQPLPPKTEEKKIGKDLPELEVGSGTITTEFEPILSEQKKTISRTVFIRQTDTGETYRITFSKDKNTGETTVMKEFQNGDTGEFQFISNESLKKLEENWKTTDLEEIIFGMTVGDSKGTYVIPDTKIIDKTGTQTSPEGTETTKTTEVVSDKVENKKPYKTLAETDEIEKNFKGYTPEQQEIAGKINEASKRLGEIDRGGVGTAEKYKGERDEVISVINDNSDILDEAGVPRPHIAKGILLARELTDQQVYDKAVDALRGYIERNKTAESFISDVNTLGQTFGEFEGDLEVEKGKVTIELADGRIYGFKAKDIYESGKKSKTTQADIVKEAVSDQPKSIKEIAEETKILEPNIRRILGVGEKEGTFTRVDKGVYILNKDGQDIAFIETGNAVEVLPRLAKDGFKADMVFLDIPYKTAAVTGGNRGVKYNLLSVDDFSKVLDSVSTILRDEDSILYYMYSKAKSGVRDMMRYNQLLADKGFNVIGEGNYTKYQLDGVTRVRNMRGNVIEPEGIIMLNKSGSYDGEPILDFDMVRPKGYQTEKPADMLDALILQGTEVGGVVLDPFAGSGVTLAEAVKKGRIAYGIEISEKAVEEYIKPKLEEAVTEVEVLTKPIDEGEKIVDKPYLRINVRKQGDKWQSAYAANNSNSGVSLGFQKFSDNFDSRQEAINKAAEEVIKSFTGIENYIVKLTDQQKENIRGITKKINDEANSLIKESAIETSEQAEEGVPINDELPYDPKQLELTVYNPGTIANPGSKYQLQARYKGFAADKLDFDTREEAEKAMETYEFKGMTANVAEDYAGSRFFGDTYFNNISKKPKPTKLKPNIYDQVSFTKNGKALTGTVESVDYGENTVRVDVNQISTYAGGVPIGRIETVNFDDLEIINRHELTYSEKIDKAKELGTQAFKDGKKRIPAQDVNLEELLRGLVVGQSKPILETWTEAWDKANLAAPIEAVASEGEKFSVDEIKKRIEFYGEKRDLFKGTSKNDQEMRDHFDTIINELRDKIKTENGIINIDETTTIQPSRVSDTSEVRQPDDRERNPEIDERTLHDETTGVSESGNGLKRTGTTGGKVTRAEANNVAESILQAHDFSTDRKDYTQEELDQLALYSGAGGKAEAGATGKGLLSEYYTPSEVKDKVWEIVDKLTPIIINSSDLNTYTKALEPSIGIGSLLGGMRNGFKFEAYEYQKVSGTIAKLLNPDIDVHIGNGEEFGNEGNFETHEPKADKDLVIGNPPFGERASFLKGKGVEPKINRWEEFFIKRGLDSLREGGYLVYVVNSSFLNKENSIGKEEIAKVGELVAAYRLPEGIFADTTIGTDIVVFKKGTQSAVESRSRTINLRSGIYFENNPDNVAGTIENRTNRFGKEEQYVKGTLEDVKKLSTILEQPETKETEQVISNEPTNNKYFINVRQEDGSLKFIETSGKKVEVKHIVDAFIHKDIEKREDKMNWVVSEGKTGMVIARDTTQQTAIEKANRLTDTAGETRVAEHIVKSITENGVSPRYSGKPTPAIKDIKEPSYSIKVKREITRQTKKEILPAVIKPDKAKVETVPVQTVSGGVSNIDPVESKVLKETKVDGSVDYIAEAKKYLNYNNGKYYHDINYFSGDIYQKLEELKSDKNEIMNRLGQAQYDKQLKGLEAVKPKPVTLNDITFDPLDRYINEVVVDEESGIKLLNQFVEFLNKTDSALSYGVSRWDVRNYVMGYRASPGTKNIMGAIKSDSARLFNYFVRNVLPSEIQNQIVDKFNREKNSYVNPDYSRIPTEIKDMAKFFRGKTFKLSPTQSNGVSFLTNKGVGLIAYGVGVGKTHTLLTATMVAKQKGWTKRPVFIVPKSTLSQTWISTIKSMFPNETIINLGGLNKPDVTRLEKERGKDKTKWIKDGEVAVLTHEGLLRLALTPDEMNEAVGDLTDALSSETATARQEEIQKSKIQEIVGKAQYKAGDINITDLGIDHISVDEVHNFRKIFQGAKPEAVLPDGTVDKSKTKRFANVIGGTPSKQAQQLFLISQHILKKNNNRGVFLASATPFENHATEVYNILSLVARDRLKKIGIFNINDFFALFSNFETELEKNVRGEWVNKEKMKSFKNLPQLQKILREFVDYQTDPTLVRPERKVLTPTLQMSALQEENLRKIQEMLKPDDGRKPEDGAVLKASTYSVANSISPYFIKEYQPQIVTPEELVDNSPKLKYSMELIKWLKGNEATKRYGTFMYLGSNGVEYHNHLAEYVVKHLGFKDSEVAVINGATSNDEREAIKQEFNDGKVKVLIGGDPTKEGIDLQNNGYVTINVALGWNPTEPAQVEGRVWRQGNKRNIAPLIYPLVENSGDVTVYNKFEEKGSRINDLFSYQGQIFDVGELDPREKKLALMTNPEDKAAIEIEMDKAGLQNQLMVYNTDIGNYKRIKDSVERLTDRIKFNEERITTGKTQWGSPIDKEGISNYRKELTKSKNELKNIQEKLDKNNITDIDGEIAKIETLKEQLNIELGKISETYKDRLAKFQREYDDMIANRKSISGHVNDFIEATKDLKELSDEEVATKKEQLIKELEAKQIKDASFEYKAPSGNADIGGYADLEASGIVVDHIRTIQFPEMVSMVRELTGDVPTLKRFKRALGRMYESGKGYIKLNPDIFNNPVQAAKTLAHEIGHLADFIPDGFTSRGNLIGRIASLSKFMQGKYGDLNNREIKQELKNLTQLWKPFDETVNENFTKYRYSSKELYADAVSVLLNDPGLLQKVAPKFYDGFFEYINSKPELEKVYFDTLEMLDKGEEAINNKRLEEIYEGFREARQKREEIESTEKPKKPFWERVMRNHITKFDPIYRKLSKVDIGVVESSKQKMREALEIYQMRRNDQAVFLDKVTTEITDALDKIGMTEDDLGVVLKLEREALGDRINLANPGGLIGNIPEVTLEYFYKQKNLTDEQIKVFEQIKTRFHELIFSETERAVNNGNFNKQVFEEKIVPNKDTYATFSVVDYIHKNYISAGIKQQTGTLKRIENPFTSSILKTVALIDWNNVQEAKQIAVGELQQYFPDDVKPAKATRTNKGSVIRFKAEDNMEVLEMMENGRRIGFNVDPYIKSMFENENFTADEVHQLVGISRAFNKLFKPLVTTYNLSWGFFSNIIRDFKRTYISLGASLNKFAPDKKNISIGEMLVSYIKSIPQGAKFAAGKRTELITEMLKNKAITTTWSQYDPNANNDTSIAFLLRQHKLLGKEEKVGAVRKLINNSVGRLLDGIKYAGGVFEATSKISGYQLAKKRVSDGKRLGFITRNYVGTPNYTEGGTWKQMDNDIFVFSNVMIQATRASVELAVDPKTASGYWMRIFIVGVLPKLLMVAGLAGLFGEWVKKNFQSQTEYDKTNYITIPVGFDENGKAVYIRIPQDETERFVSAIVWKTLSSIAQKKIVKPQQIGAIGAGYIPSVTPLWTALGDWVGYLQGRNPYDSYRGRLAIDETAWKAGGLIRLGKMVQYSANTLGLSNFKTYDSGNRSTTEVILDRIPVINRMFQTSNYGLQEKFDSSAEQESAKKSIKKRDIVDKYVKLSRGIEDPEELSKLRTDMVKEYFGGELPTNKDLINEGKQLAKKFTIQRERGSSPYMDKLIYSNLNAEKLDYLKQFQKDMSVADFKNLVNDALKYKIISKDVVNELKILDKQSGYEEKKMQVEEKKSGLLNFDFNLVKKAYAAENLDDTKKRIVWDLDMRSKWQKFIDKVVSSFTKSKPVDPEEEKRSAEAERQKNKEGFEFLKNLDMDWYVKNIGKKVEKKLTGEVMSDKYPTKELNKYEADTVKIFDEYEIPREVIYGMAKAEGGKIGSYNLFNVGAVDSDPKKAINYKSQNEATIAIAKLLTGTFTKEDKTKDTKYKEAWQNRDNPVKMLKMIEAAGFAGNPDTWKERSIKDGGAGINFDHWSDFVMATPEWKKWYNKKKD